MKKYTKLIYNIFGIETKKVSHIERIASALGGFISILCIIVICQWFIGNTGIELLVASMGATAVLLFAVPHGQMSQPWAVLGGHVISAVIGVSCALYISNNLLAAGAAVGLAIGVMYYLKCVHPPGGATALSAVMGGEAIQSLGYQFVITPVLINTLVILSIALVFNYLFKWRRYPLYLYKKQQTKSPSFSDSAEISHGDFVYALSQVDSFVDVSEYDLLHIYELATNRSRDRRNYIEDIKTGEYYSNGEYGENWSVRQILDESTHQDTNKDMLSYKTVAGMGRRTSGIISRADFAKWARYKVIRDEDNWKRVIAEEYHSD